MRGKVGKGLGLSSDLNLSGSWIEFSVVVRVK